MIRDSKATKTYETIQDYYGRILTSKRDLQTNACCVAEQVPVRIQSILEQIHPAVREKFYGCGLPLPPLLEGRTVLDLGCGAGRDVYLLSKLVGEQGQVIGVDMTEGQLQVARCYLDYHRDKFGYADSNVSFRQGYIEDLRSLDIMDQSVDIVISNCVINLSPAQEGVFAEVFRVLKPGGELYFSDVFADRRVPLSIRSDPVLLGECLGGALYTEDFRRIMAQVGCPDLRVISKAPLVVSSPAIRDKLGVIHFSSQTIRAFKLSLEDRCEDYGHVAIYLGGITESPHEFHLDDHHCFERDRPMLVCGNTARMLSETRYQSCFEVIGSFERHYGLFECVPIPQKSGGTGTCC